ncbi:hypothetical protein KX816_08685 [Sphingosinicellaceae bacterium]|nr:hypothetical protein KX816_08685 [Sphingosinicellaceae bacterium]
MADHQFQAVALPQPYLLFLGPAEAGAAGARSMVIGVANSGGFVQPGWTASLFEALEAELDLVAGMHSWLSDIPGLADAERLGLPVADPIRGGAASTAWSTAAAADRDPYPRLARC